MRTGSRFSMWMRAAAGAAMLAAALAPLTGCKLPGKPGDEPEVPRPEQITSFDALYGSNCAGCHGANGQNGSAMNLANPMYQALVDDATLKEIVSSGEAGTLMPAFGTKSGGALTEAQIDAIVAGVGGPAGRGGGGWGEKNPADKDGRAG